jgi:regulator of protease activity HflC (stomatin/prohibitin superfamily)
MTTAPLPARPTLHSRIDAAFRVSVVVLAVILVAVLLLVISQAALYKIHPYEAGLHLRGGRFLAEDAPGWHVQIPYVDTVIIVKVNERLGYVERISAVTADNLQMIVSLQYTYRVSDPARFALEIDDPERILFELVQGKLRDVANSQTMTDMMNNRASFNQTMLTELSAREEQYGVEFVTVQIQSAEPPADVVSAIEDRMVAVQRQAQAEAEADQQRVLADAEFYAAQKRADAEAYQITQIATAQQASIRLLLGELSQHPAIAAQYLEYLKTQELAASGGAQWVIGQPGSTIIDLGAGEPQPVP